MKTKNTEALPQKGQKYGIQITPAGKGSKNDVEAATKACRYFRMDDVPVSPVLAFSFLDDEDWLKRFLSKALLKNSKSVVVCADEVTEQMITEIKYAQELKLPIRFYDASLHEINVDALVINKRIGPGLRKMIMDVNGISCASGGCPYGAVTGEPEKEKVTPEREKVTAAGEAFVKAPVNAPLKAAESTQEKKSIFKRLFGRK